MKNSRAIVAIVLGVVLALGVVACSRSQSNQAAQKAGEAGLSGAVKGALMADTSLNASQIGVETDHDKVTLSGTVDSQAAKDHAEQVAKGVPGVGSVTNDLKVNEQQAAAGSGQTGAPAATAPAGATSSNQFGSSGSEDKKTTEADVSTAVKNALAADTSIDSSQIGVEASGQKVTLTGTVSSQAAKDKAEQDAKAVSGVTSVSNNLKVNEQQRGTVPPAGASSSSSSATSSQPGSNVPQTSTGAAPSDVSGAPSSANPPASTSTTQTETSTSSATSTGAAPSAGAQSAPSSGFSTESAQSRQPSSSRTIRGHRGRLPQTASDMPLVGLLGLLSLAGGLAVRAFRQ